MFRKKDFGRALVCKVLVAAVILWSFPPLVQTAGAGNGHAEYAGQAMASGAAYLLSSAGERLDMDAYPMPIFHDSVIKTAEGAVVITLAPGGLVEVDKESEVRITRKGDTDTVELKSGTLRFSVPAQTSVSVTTHEGMVSVRAISKFASTEGTRLPAPSGDRAGAVRVVEDMGTVITGERGTFEVMAGDEKAVVVGPGETIMLAQAGASTGGGGLLAGFTRSQLSALSAQPGVKAIPGATKVPALAKGEVALAIPADIGGGFIVGTPEAIAAGLNKVGLVTATSVDVLNEAEEEERRRRLGWWPIVGGGLAVAAIAAAMSGGGGGGGHASPSVP